MASKLEKNIFLFDYVIHSIQSNCDTQNEFSLGPQGRKKGG